MPLTISEKLLWYKQLAVRQAMIVGARNKEIGVRYEDSFGKRPDALDYEQEILDLVLAGATSFHASEEIWSNPRSIETGMNKTQIDELRTGWDLVFDVDFTNFEATKRITAALCRALKENGVHTFGVKFSGNKGFHIGVAWQSFPETVDGMETRTLFPDLTRQIASYIVHAIDNPDNNFSLSSELDSIVDEDRATHQKVVCSSCGRDRIEAKTGTHFVCPKCGKNEHTLEDVDYLSCPACSSFMDRVEARRKTLSKCVCGSTDTRSVFDLKIDTQLIASRHLYRLEYSLHEKSGLASLPINPDEILSFEREHARPHTIKSFPPFWYRDARGQANQLVIAARKFRPHDEAKQILPQREVIWEADAAPEAAFPPTIKKILAGLTDGKKRALFILTNFLRSVGWNYDMIEQRLREWNEKNTPPLREHEIVSHVRYHRARKDVILAPNFDNDVYKDLGVLIHDELSASPRVKNPLQYVKLRLKQQGVPEKKKSTKSLPSPSKP